MDSVTVHGVTDEKQDISSYFAFGNTLQSLPDRDSVLVSILTPHLHEAVTELLRKGSARASVPRSEVAALSKREREVLTWVQAGKTNHTIGMILGISEYTVKNHMKRICSKLDASNRAHAVAKGVHSGLLMPVAMGGLRALLP